MAAYGEFRRFVGPLHVRPNIVHVLQTFNLPMSVEKFVNSLKFELVSESPDDTMMVEFKRLRESMMRLILYYKKEFDVSSQHTIRMDLGKRKTFRLSIEKVLHHWNCFIIRYNKCSDFIPQLMLDTECECCVYAVKPDSRRDPTILMLKGALFTITQDEAMRRIESPSKQSFYTPDQRETFKENLQAFAARSHMREDITNFEKMWFDPVQRHLFIQQFHYYLNLFKN